MDEPAVRAMDQEVIAEVEDAYQFADQAPDPDPDALYRDVYAEKGERSREKGRTDEELP